MNRYIKYAISFALASFLTDKIMETLDKKKDENK
jgi:hypothetical protein